MNDASSVSASGDRIVRNKPAFIRILDWAAAIAGLAFGGYLVASGWPEPGVWAWLFLAAGVVGVPLAMFNPLGKVHGLILRRLIKRKR